MTIQRRPRRPSRSAHNPTKAARSPGRPAPGKTTVREHFEERYEWRRSEAETGEGLKPSTLAAEREAIDLYIAPGLGHLEITKLGDQHIRDLYAAMRLINRDGETSGEHAELLRRLAKARATRDGRRLHTRPISESRIRRVHAVLTGGLNDAVYISRLIDTSPAVGVFRTKGGARRRRIRPLLWTDERVERWQRTGHVPAPVMVWTSAHCGNFLDFSEASEERLHPLFHLDAYWGLRRGELVGLERSEVSLPRRRLYVRQSQAEDELDDTKSEAGDRTVVFDEGTEAVLRAASTRQSELRLLWGEAYEDSGRFFTYENGTALKPAYVSDRFGGVLERHAAVRKRLDEGWTAEKVARRHRLPVEAVRIAASMPLPPIRFHDLRHGAATMLLAAGVDMKLVADVLGHASSNFTRDVYAVVAEELAASAAVAIAAFVPRRNRRFEVVG